MRTRFGQRKGDYEAYISHAKGAGGDIRDAVGTPRRRGEQLDDEDEDYEDDYDYDDYEYDDDGDGEYAGRANDPIDDYPVSDDDHTYYDDDYRSH